MQGCFIGLKVSVILFPYFIWKLRLLGLDVAIGCIWSGSSTLTREALALLDWMSVFTTFLGRKLLWFALSVYLISNFYISGWLKSCVYISEQGWLWKAVLKESLYLLDFGEVLKLICFFPFALEFRLMSFTEEVFFGWRSLLDIISDCK